MGDARLDYDALTYGWFDHFLKGEDNHDASTRLPKVRYYTMGLNKWQTSDTWPPAGAQPVTLSLAGGGKANTLKGDGALAAAAPAPDAPDGFTYDPMNPVPSLRRQRVLHGHRRDGPAHSISARWRCGPTSWSTQRSRSRTGRR